MAEREHPVLLHIEDAEAWLARAKEHYRAAAPLQGELDLNLAQAEVRYAWELSRKKREKGLKPDDRESSGRRLFSWVSLAIVTGMVLVGFILSFRRPTLYLKTRTELTARGPSPAVVEKGQAPSILSSLSEAESHPPKEGATKRVFPTGGRKEGGPSPSPGAGAGVNPPATMTGVEKVEGIEGTETEKEGPQGEEAFPAREMSPPALTKAAISSREDGRAVFDLTELEQLAREVLYEGTTARP